ncbi:MAG TPA: SRPBCC domain-containing protein [Gammaproteobacteria bacterium]
MNEHAPLKHGEFSIKRRIKAPRELVYRAWTGIEHRKHWFVGPGNWQPIERSVDLKVGGKEIAHGRMEDGTETLYTARFHLIIPNAQLIYAFDMHVAGKHFSVSLAGVEFEDGPAGTVMTYTEQAFYLNKDYGNEGRIEGTHGLLDQFTTYLDSIV